MPPRLFAILLCLPLAVATADTVKLKSGEVIEGRVTSADDKAVTIEIQYSASIIDSRTIPRAEIAQFAIESGDEAAFAKIRDVKSPDTALGTKSCQKLIDDVLLPFLREFPSSPRTADVQLKIRDLRADIVRLKAGDVKVSGVWYGKDDFTVEKYQIEAAAALDAMRRNYDAKNFPAAINSFELLQRSYPNSLAYVEGLKLAPDALSKLQQQLNLEIGNLPQTKAMRQAAIDRTPVEQRQPIQQAIAAEDARAIATATLARQKQQRFYTISSFDERGLKDMLTAAQQIEKQLGTVNKDTLTQGARLVRRATDEINSNHLAGARTSIAQLKETWPSYEGLTRLDQKLTTGEAANKASADKASAAADALTNVKKQP